MGFTSREIADQFALTEEARLEAHRNLERLHPRITSALVSITANWKKLLKLLAARKLDDALVYAGRFLAAMSTAVSSRIRDEDRNKLVKELQVHSISTSPVMQIQHMLELLKNDQPALAHVFMAFAPMHPDNGGVVGVFTTKEVRVLTTTHPTRDGGVGSRLTSELNALGVETKKPGGSEKGG